MCENVRIVFHRLFLKGWQLIIRKTKENRRLPQVRLHLHSFESFQKQNRINGSNSPLNCKNIIKIWSLYTVFRYKNKERRNKEKSYYISLDIKIYLGNSIWLNLFLNFHSIKKSTEILNFKSIFLCNILYSLWFIFINFYSVFKYKHHIF